MPEKPLVSQPCCATTLDKMSMRAACGLSEQSLSLICSVWYSFVRNLLDFFLPRIC